MNELKKRFKEDPAFAMTVIVVGTIAGTAVLNAIAKNVTATAYAYRASKM